MKKLFYVMGLGLFLATTSVQAKVGVVNVAEIFQQMPEREKISKQLESEFKGRLAELQKMEADLQTNIQKIQSEGAKMKAADRTKLEKSIQDKQSAFAAKAEAFQQDNSRRQTEERNKLLAKIQKAVQDVAKKEKYTVVVDVSAVAYADPTTDITTSVAKQVK